VPLLFPRLVSEDMTSDLFRGVKTFGHFLGKFYAVASSYCTLARSASVGSILLRGVEGLNDLSASRATRGTTTELPNCL